MAARRREAHGVFRRLVQIILPREGFHNKMGPDVSRVVGS